MFHTDDEAPAEPKPKRQRVAGPVRRKPAAKPEASDEASVEFQTDDEPLATPTSPGQPVRKKPTAKPMSGAADKAEESVRKKPAAKLTADASDDAEGNEFQTTDEEPLATAVPRSKAKPKPKLRGARLSCQASTAEDEFHTDDDSTAKPPPESRKAKSVAKESNRIHADAAFGDATDLPEASGTFTFAHWLAAKRD